MHVYSFPHWYSTGVMEVCGRKVLAEESTEWVHRNGTFAKHVYSNF